MKAERIEPKQEFVPVIVTLESQEEVDALFVVCNAIQITDALPVLDSWWQKLLLFASDNRHLLFQKFLDAIRS